MTIILHICEMEAREMESRLQMLTGRPHVPLDGMLISDPPQKEVRNVS